MADEFYHLDFDRLKLPLRRPWIDFNEGSSAPITLEQVERSAERIRKAIMADKQELEMLSVPMAQTLLKSERSRCAAIVKTFLIGRRCPKTEKEVQAMLDAIAKEIKNG